jgi:hypothetical protein
VSSEGDKFIQLGKNKRATVRNFKGATLLDIREYYVDKVSISFLLCQILNNPIGPSGERRIQARQKGRQFNSGSGTQLYSPEPPSGSNKSQWQELKQATKQLDDLIAEIKK